MQGEYVRSELRTALFDMPAGQRNQLVIMGETATGDSFTKKATRVIETGSGAVQVDAEHIRYRTGRKYTQSKPLINEIDFRSVRWRQLVNKLVHPRLAWVKYCYAEQLNFDQQVIICQHVWERFQKRDNETGQRKMSQKVMAQVRSMVWLAVQVAASRIRGDSKEYKAADLAHLNGITHNNWRHHYAPRWAMLLAVCEELDNEVIAYVARQRDEERAERRRADVLM